MHRNAKRFAAAALLPSEQLRRDADEIFAALRAGNVDGSALAAKLTLRLGQRYVVSGA
jgi:hypothetical protein